MDFSRYQEKSIKFAPHAILFFGVAFITWWFRLYLTAENIASVDLPSHFVLSRGLREQLLNGRITFYDHATFTGFPAFRFYGFLPTFCVVLLSYPLTLFSSDPVVLSTHVFLVLGMALIPISFFYAALPLAEEILGGRDLLCRHRYLLALLSLVFSFWFINHDHQWHGIGAAAVMNIGLFAQLFGFHLILLYVGALCRFRRQARSKSFLPLVLIYALLPLSHTLTFVYSSFLFALALLLFQQQRKSLIVTHILGLGLAAFWFLPSLALLSEYTAYDVYRPKGDFLEVFYRYPIYSVLRSFRTWVTGKFEALSLVDLLLPVLTLVLLAHSRIPKNGQTFSLFLMGLLSILFFSSGFVATSLPIGLHYYRFIGYEFLLLTVVLSVVPLVWAAHPTKRLAIHGLIVVLCLAAFLNTTLLPHYERRNMVTRVGVSYLEQERKVVEFFKNQSTKGRVYVEYLNNYKRFPKLSAHYISSRLYVETGFEAVVNSHLQESLAYRMIAFSARMLGAKTYNTPLLAIDQATLDDETALAQMKEFGITHIISGRRKLSDKLRTLLALPPTEIGKYKIFQIAQAPHVAIEPVKKTLIGYLDLQGNMPFRLVQTYFHARRNLFWNYQLLALRSEEEIPTQVGLTLVNMSHNRQLASLRGASGENVRSFAFQDSYLLKHYDVHYPHNIELDQYRAIEDYLDKIFRSQPLKERSKKPLPTLLSQTENPVFTWSEDHQSFTIQGLIPGVFYRINYSYFPYWRTTGARLFRGSGERMFLLAESDTARGTYSAWHVTSSWVGLFLTIVSGLICWLKRKDSGSSIKSRT